MIDKEYKIQDTRYKIQGLTGGYIAAEFLRQLDPDVAAVYPITPQTPIIETFAKMKADGKVETEIIQVESEHSAMSAAIGAAASGVRSVTATSSQGLALMHEMLYIASGLRLPVFMYVSARALAAPINIHGEHGDVMGSRDAGWIQIFSENVQDVYENSFVALKLAEKVKLPVMVIMDGFNTSHTVEKTETFSDEDAKNFLGEYRAEKSLFDFENPVTFGALALQNSYFEFKLQQQQAFDEALEEFPKIASEFKKEFGKELNIFEGYELEDAENVIVIAGSVSGTVKSVIDRLRKGGKKVGLLQIRMFRPFPYSQIAEALKNAKNIAVLDRAISLGAYPPIYTDIILALNSKSYKLKAKSYIYGLGGRETYEKDIEKVFEEMEKGKNDKKINYIK